MTNGRQWRLYSRHAHSRATNFYEVDLAEALVASGDTDPNEAFRYWWLFFRAAASARRLAATKAAGSMQSPREAANTPNRLGERLKERIFETIFPHLAAGIPRRSQTRLGMKRRADRRRTSRRLRSHAHAALSAAVPAVCREPRSAADPRGPLPRRQPDKNQGRDCRQSRTLPKRKPPHGSARPSADSDTSLYDRLHGYCARRWTAATRPERADV